jgi:hypothetical protein
MACCLGAAIIFTTRVGGKRKPCDNLKLPRPSHQLQTLKVVITFSRMHSLWHSMHMYIS